VKNVVYCICSVVGGFLSCNVHDMSHMMRIVYMMCVTYYSLCIEYGIVCGMHDVVYDVYHVTCIMLGALHCICIV